MKQSVFKLLQDACVAFAGRPRAVDPKKQLQLHVFSTMALSEYRIKTITRISEL